MSSAPEDAKTTVAPHRDLVRWLAAAAVDPDYARVARSASPPAHVRRTGARAGMWVVLLVLGLVVVTSGAEVRSTASQTARERDALVAQINQRKAVIAASTARLETLRAEVSGLQGTASLDTQRNADLLAGLAQARTLTGAAAVTGPGVRVVVDNAPPSRSGNAGKVLDSDLQLLVNGLWQAGAEAITINGNRLTALSAVRTAGSAITVNYQSLSSPYVVQAIGNPATLPARFVDTAAGQAWLDLQTNFGIRFDLRRADAMVLPAAPAPRLHVPNAQRRGELP